MIPGIQEIKALAFKYSKKQLASMAQTGLIDPQKAVMAGMMRDRIAKEDTQPPTTTVAQDALGLAPQPQMPQMGMASLASMSQGQPPAPQMPQGQAPAPQMAQTQPQTPPPQMGAPLKQPPVMAASGGVTSLPVDIADYAGGGIVAFGDGGDIPGYAGDEGSAVRYQPGVFESGFQFPENSFFGALQRGTLPFQESQAMRNAAELQRIEQRLGEPNLSNAERQRLETGRRALIDLTSQTYPSEGARGAATFVRPNAPAAGPSSFSGTPPSPQRRGTGEAPSLGGFKTSTISGPTTLEPPVVPAAPELPPLDLNKVKIQGEDLPIYTERERKAITGAREEAEREAGVDPEMYTKMIKGMEEKKGKLEKRKGEMGGEALMQFGLGLIGARRGEEFQVASKSGREALNAYKQDVKDLRAAEEKYDERIDALRMSDQQAKLTGARADIAQAEQDRQLAFNSKMDVAKAKNELIKTGALISSQTRGQDIQQQMDAYKTKVQAAQQTYDTQQRALTAREGYQVQRDIAAMQAQTSREYTSALKAQGLQDSQIKNIMSTASEIYKAILSKNPTADEATSWNAALRQASLGYAQVAPMVGRKMPNVPTGTLEPGPNGTSTYVPPR